jgi:hypothetical protein
MNENMRDCRPTAGHTEGDNLTGYKVEATDGSIGTVDKHSNEVGSSYLVIDTGVWILGKQVLLPAGTVSRIDTEDEKIYVELTRAEIKDAPRSAPPAPCNWQRTTSG